LSRRALNEHGGGAGTVEKPNTKPSKKNEKGGGAKHYRMEGSKQLKANFCQKRCFRKKKKK